uniref:Arginine/serine-rich protein 1 n=1 Tax=Haemonchus contortus TaxID=6289 RepID=A0A7I4Z5V7_HAECO
MTSSIQRRNSRKRQSSRRRQRSTSSSRSSHSSNSKHSLERKRSRRPGNGRGYSRGSRSGSLVVCRHCGKPQKTVSFAEPESTVCRRRARTKSDRKSCCGRPRRSALKSSRHRGRRSLGSRSISRSRMVYSCRSKRSQHTGIWRDRRGRLRDHLGRFCREN